MNLIHSPYKIRVVYVIIFFFIAIFFTQDYEFGNKYLFAKNSSLPINQENLKSCDIIFRRGLSLVSNLVLSADSHSPFSHIGIIIKEKKNITVVHVVPDESETGIDIIKKDELNEFLRSDRASAYAVYRYKSEIDFSKLESYIKSQLKREILFDGEFDLSSSDKLYCTEFVYKSFLEAGIDLIDNKFDTLLIPIGKNPFILPGRILTSSYLTKITEYFND